MKKVVLNKCYGGFGMSEEAYRLYAKKMGKELFIYQRDENGDYYKVEHDNENEFFHYTTKDLGNKVKLSDINSDKDEICDLFIQNDDPILVEVVEELGERASGEHSKLEIEEVPDGYDYEIDEYDGFETLNICIDYKGIIERKNEQIEQLKEQLAEKDKEILMLKCIIKKEHPEIERITDTNNELTIILDKIVSADEKAVRKDICEKIKNLIDICFDVTETTNENGTKYSKEFSFKKFNAIINAIEKGE